MPDKPTREPGLWKEYWQALLKHWWWVVTSVAFSGAYDIVNYMVGLCDYKLDFPRWVPLALAGLALVVAQFLAFKEMRKQRDEARSAAMQRRPRVYVVFDWQGSFLEGCYEPFVLKNDSDIPAQRVHISEIAGGSSQVARFPLVSLLDGHQERQVWSDIEDADTRNGHPDFGRFMWVALIAHAGEALSAAEHTPAKSSIKEGEALPFEISYRDLDGREWRTYAHVKIGGEWGAGRIIVETLRLG